MFKQYIKKVRDVLLLIVSAIVVAVSSPAVSKYIYSVFFKFWQGFSRILNPDVVPYLLRAKHSREVLVESLNANGRAMAAYAGIWLFYEMVVRQLSRYVMPGTKDSMLEYGMDTAVRVMLCALVLRNRLDNAMLSAAMVQASKKDNPEVDRRCPHTTLERIQGVLAGELYYASSVAVVNVAGFAVSRTMPWFLSAPASVVMFSFLEGRRLVERGLANAMCTDDRKRLLNQNAYVFGVGLSYVTARGIWNYLLSRNLSLTSDSLLDCAVAGFLFQYYLMLFSAYDVVLPGGAEGVDLGAPVRQLTRAVGNEVVSALQPYVTTQSSGMDFVKVEKMLSYRASQYVETIVFGASWRSRWQFFERPIPLLLSELYRSDVVSSVRQFEDWTRSMKASERTVRVIRAVEDGVGVIAWMLNVNAPELLAAYKKQVVMFVSSPEFDWYFNYFKDMLRFIEELQKRKSQVGYAQLQDDRVDLDQGASFGRSVLRIADSTTTMPMPASLPAAARPASMLVAEPVPAIVPALSVNLTQARVERAPAYTMVNVVLTLRLIAGLPRWRSNGLGVFGSKVPNGVTSLRAVSDQADIAELLAVIRHKLNVNDENRTGIVADITDDYYRLIKRCADRRWDPEACFYLMDDFLGKYKFTTAERVSIKMPLLPSSSLGGANEAAAAAARSPLRSGKNH